MHRPDYIIIRDIVSFKEVKYIFNQGRPTLVIGENKDNPSQKGNGAGKSILQDGIALAFTGAPVRNVSSTKKLVRRGCEFGEIEFGMHNTMFRNEVTIHRKIYAGGKSQEVKLFVNQEQVILSDVNEYNKYIFNTLAISKEDFFNFYLITKDYYKPFFRVGDVSKKDIINRFSGADKVDGVDVAIDDDVKVWEGKIVAIQRQLDINQGKQEITSDNIMKLQTATDSVELEERKNALTQLQSEALEDAEQYNDVIEEEEFILTKAQKAKTEFQQEDFDFAILLERGTIDQITKKIAERRAQVPLVKNEFHEEVVGIMNREAGTLEGKATTKVNIKEAQQIIADLEASLAGTIHCPSCAHEFVLADHSFDVEQGKKDLIEAQGLLGELEVELCGWDQILEEYQKEKDAVNQKVAEISQQLRDENNKDQERITELTQKITGIETQKRVQQQKVRDLEDAVTASERRLTQYKEAQLKAIEKAEQIQVEIDKPAIDNTQAVEEQEAQLLAFLDEGTDLSDKLGEAQGKLQEVKEWYGNFKSFKSYLANQSIRNVQDYTNLYLQQMGSDLSIEIEGYKKQSTGKLKEQINTIVCRDGLPEDEYGCYSGGERGRIDVACILAIQHLINLNSTSGGLDLLIADEIFDSIDSLGLEHIFKGLLLTDRTVLFISQVQVNALQSNTLLVRKTNKVSSIFIGPQS